MKITQSFFWTMDIDYDVICHRTKFELKTEFVQGQMKTRLGQFRQFRGVKGVENLFRGSKLF